MGVEEAKTPIVTDELLGGLNLGSAPKYWLESFSETVSVTGILREVGMVKVYTSINAK